MALTCNVKTVCRVLLNPGVWPVGRSDPSRVEAESTQASLHVSAHARRRLEWPAGPEQAETILGTWILPGTFGGWIFRYVYIWPSRNTDCTAPIRNNGAHIRRRPFAYPWADEDSVGAALPGHRGIGTQDDALQLYEVSVRA